MPEVIIYKQQLKTKPDGQYSKVLRILLNGLMPYTTPGFDGVFLDFRLILSVGGP